MMKIRNFVAAGAAAAIVSVGGSVAAEESVSLLSDVSAGVVGGQSAEAAKPADSTAELLENIRTTERLRREALDTQATREIMDARECMDEDDFEAAVRHYGLAQKLLNDRPASRKLRRECEQGIAEGLYRQALQEDDLGRRAQAKELMNKALDQRHPKARKVLEDWEEEETSIQKPTDVADLKHRVNDEEFKQKREQIRRHLKRARQFLAVREIDKALEEVDVVLVNDPHNQEAIRLRKSISGKRQTILEQERKATRIAMIADVDEAWRPVYSVSSAQLGASAAETVKAQLGDDPERTQEQDIERRMREMRLPTISFRPPATIMDAVEFFRQASKDYDRPDIPLEKRGFNFVLKTPQPLRAAAGDEESDDFSSGDSASSSGLDPIPTISASDITFYEALKLVCDSVDYKFIVRGPVVMVMHRDMSTAELLSRKYDVPEAFVERVESASSEMKESGGFGSSGSKKAAAKAAEEESPDGDWKGFFEEMGVKWPEGSSIKHMKSLGKLYVRNTRENLAEFEKILEELGGQSKLIEIETRFVEVAQEDLNSLGFEWILNSDYSLNLGNALGKALGIKNGDWGSNSYSIKESTSSDSTFDVSSSTVDGSTLSSDVRNNSRTGSSKIDSAMTRFPNGGSNGAGWGKFSDGSRAIGINAFGGSSSYTTGQRYLSTMGNHISGESKSNNDQFMRVNAFLGSADLSMILHMLSQRSDTDLLSAPKVVTKSGQQAIIKAVTEYIYPQDYDVQLQSSSSSGSSGGSSSAILAVVEPQNFTMREVGVILDVLPTYNESQGGMIDLELKPSVVDEPTWKNYGMKIPFTGNAAVGSALDPATYFNWIPGATEKLAGAIGSLLDSSAEAVAASYVDSSIAAMNPSTITYYDAPMEQPFFKVRSIETKVSIAPGATVVLGGLITEQRKAMDDKVPFLGDLPFVGRLFRSHSEQTLKRNLLIFVTGRLLNLSGREIKIGDASEETAEVKAAPSAE